MGSLQSIGRFLGRQKQNVAKLGRKIPGSTMIQGLREWINPAQKQRFDIRRTKISRPIHTMASAERLKWAIHRSRQTHASEEGRRACEYNERLKQAFENSTSEHHRPFNPT